MDTILDFFAGILAGLTDQTGSMVAAIGIYTALTCFVAYPLTRKSAENILLSELLRDEIAAVRERHKKHPEKISAEISMLLARRHYGIFASAICTLVQGFLGVPMALSLGTEKLRDVGGSLLRLDLGMSPYMLWGTTQDIFLPVVVLAAAALGLQFLHDRLMQRDLITDQKIQDLVMLGAVALGCALLPVAFSLYWALHEIVDILVMLCVTKIGRKRFFQRLRRADVPGK